VDRHNAWPSSLPFPCRDMTWQPIIAETNKENLSSDILSSTLALVPPPWQRRKGPQLLRQHADVKRRWLLNGRFIQATGKTPDAPTNGSYQSMNAPTAADIANSVPQMSQLPRTWDKKNRQRLPIVSSGLAKSTVAWEVGTGK